VRRPVNNVIIVIFKFFINAHNIISTNVFGTDGVLMCCDAVNQSIDQSINHQSLNPLRLNTFFFHAVNIILYVINILCMFVYCKNFFEKTHSQHILYFIKDTGIYKTIFIIKYRILNMYILI